MKRIDPYTIIFLVTFIVLNPMEVEAQEIKAWLSTRYNYEHDDDGSDNDLSGYLTVSAKNYLENRLDLYLSGWFNESFFNGDTEPVNDDYIRISEAYFKLKSSTSPLILSLGRQRLYSVENTIMDGVTFDVTQKKWQWKIYAGVPFSYYEGTANDFLSGTSLVLQPWWQCRLQGDVYWLKENNIRYRGGALRLNQYIPVKKSRLMAVVRSLDSEVRDFYANLSSFFEEINTTTTVNYFYQPNIRGEGIEAFSTSFSNFGQIFNTSYANQRISFNIQSFFNDNWLINAGVTYKDILQKGKEKLFWANEDAITFQGGLTRTDFLRPGLHLTVLGNYIENELDEFFDLTVELEYEVDQTLDLSAGITYTGYNFSNVVFPDSLHEQEAVYALADNIGSRIYYLDCSFHPRRNHKISVAAAYEDIDTVYDDAIIFTFSYRYYFNWSGKKPR